MLPAISFIIPILNLMHESLQFIEKNENESTEDDMFIILKFINVIPIILEILSYAYDLTKDISRENDACKLIHYLSQYR